MKFSKTEIVVGQMIYGIPTNNAAPDLFAVNMGVPKTGEQLVGCISSILEEGKKYLVEWSKGDESFETIETASSVRAAIFNMKFYKEMLGMNLPQ